MDKHEDWNKTNSVIDRVRNSEMESGESAAAEGQSSTQGELFENKLRSILFPEPIFSQYIGELSAKPSKPVKFPSVESVAMGSDKGEATLSDSKKLKKNKRPPKLADPQDQPTGTRKRPPVRPQYTRYLRTWKKSVSASDRLTGYLSNLRELHLAKLIAFIEQMHKSSLYTDLDLYVDNLCFPVHRLILACYAPFIFQKLERSRTKANCPIEKLKLVNIDASSLAVLIGFMYTGLAHPNESNFLPVLNAAIHLFMFDFANAWVELYEHRFTNRTAQLLFRSNIARQYGWTDYQQMLNVALAFDFEHLLISDQFEALPVEQLRDILRLDNVGVVSEVVLYLAVLKWLNFDFEQRKQHALDLMALIRFPAMDENELFACYNPPILPEVIELPAIKALMADAFNLQMKQKTASSSASDRPGQETVSGTRSYRGPRNYRLAGAYKPLELWCSLMPKVPGGRPAASCLRKERTPRSGVQASESSDMISPIQPSPAISKQTTVTSPVSTPTDLPTTSLIDTSVASSAFGEGTTPEGTGHKGAQREDRLKPEVRADIEQLITDGQREPTKLAVLKSSAACHCKPVRHSSGEQCRRERAARIIQRTYRRFHRRKASARSDDKTLGPGEKRPADRVPSQRPSERTSERTSKRTWERTSGTATERPSVGRSSEKRPSEEKDSDGRASAKRPSVERVSAEKPSAEKASTEKPSAELPASERRPSSRRSSRRRSSDQRSSSRRSSGRSSGRPRPKIHTKLFGKSSLKAEESDESKDSSKDPSKDSSIDEQLANRLALPEQSKRQKLKMKEKLKQDKILMSKDKSHWPSDEESVEARQFHSKAKDAERAKSQLNKSSTSSTEPFSPTTDAKKRRKGYELRVPESASLEPVQSEESARSERVGREQGRPERVEPERVRPKQVEPEPVESEAVRPDGKSNQPVPMPVPLPVPFPAPLTSARSREENETGHLAGSGKEPRTAAQRTEQLILYSDSINQEFCGFFICNFNVATPTAGSPDGQSAGWQRHFQFNQADNLRKRISAPYEPVVVSHGQSVYLVGGMQMKSKKFYVSKQVLRYQLNGRRLEAAAFSLRMPRVQHSCVVAGDRLYVICGCKKPNVPLNTVECVHLMSSRTQPSDMIKLPTFGRFGQSAVYFRSRLWIIGGIAKIDSNFHLLSEIWVLDVQNANKWIKSKFPVPIAFAGICSVNEEFIYVVGGRCVGLTGKLQPSEKVWCYSVATRRWQQIASLNQPRCNCCCVALGDRIYTFGGSPENDAEHLRGQTGEYYELRNPNQGWRMLSKNLPASIAGQSITKISFF